jgi:hypothetical protein
MKWFRILFAVVLLGLFGCSTATGPQYPQSEEDPGGQDEKDKGGMILPDVEIFFV